MKVNPYLLSRCRKAEYPWCMNELNLIESLNHVSWNKSLRSWGPKVNLTLPSPPLNHVPKSHIHTFFKYLQGWWLNRFPGQPVPMLDNRFSEEFFPNTQFKLPLVQFKAVSCCPIICYLGKETNSHLTTTSFQVDYLSSASPYTNVPWKHAVADFSGWKMATLMILLNKYPRKNTVLEKRVETESIGKNLFLFNICGFPWKMEKKPKCKLCLISF